MTEDEARKKWCPMVRWTSHDGDNRYAEPFENRGANCMCIASECMMWKTQRELIGGNEVDGFRYKEYSYCGLTYKPSGDDDD